MLSFFAIVAIAAFPGRAPSIAFDARGALHVVYVDDASGRVFHRVAGSTTATPVSLPDVKVDARGENGPVLLGELVGEFLVVGRKLLIVRIEA